MLRLSLLTFGLIVFFNCVNVVAEKPKVESTNPQEGAEVPVRTNKVSITFDQEIGVAEDKLDTLISVVLNNESIDSGFTLTLNSVGTAVTINFDSLLTASANYVINIKSFNNSDGEASDPFTLNFSTGDVAIINNITLSSKLCIGDTADLATIVINEGFLGNFYKAHENEGDHQDIQLELPDSLSFVIDDAVLSVNNGDPSDFTNGVKFSLNDSNFPGALLIGFLPDSVSGASFTDIIRLAGVKVVADSNLVAGNYNIKVVNVDSSYPGISVNDIVGTIIVRANETVSLSHDGSNGDASSVTICPGDTVIFTPTGGTAPYKFYKEGSTTILATTDTTFTTSTLQNEDKIYAVSSGSSSACEGKSASITVNVTDNTPPVITLRDIENNTQNTVEHGQTFAIPATSVGLELSADQTGTFSGEGVSMFDNTKYQFLTNDAGEGKEPGLYEVTFLNQQECKPNIIFTIEVFDNSRNQILGLRNNGICYNALDSIPIGWLGEGVEGDLVSISSTPGILTGSLNSSYNGGLSSGYFIDPEMVRDSSQVGEDVTITIEYKDNNDSTLYAQQKIGVQGVPELEIVLSGELPLKESYCENASSIKIVGNPLGTNDVVKTFSILDLKQSSNINDAIPLTDLTFFFNPADAPSAQSENILTYNDDKGYVILYEYMSEYGCVTEMTDTIQVVPLPDSLSTDPIQFDFCVGDEVGYIKIDKPDTVDIAWHNSQGFLLAVADSLDPGVNTSFPDIFDFTVRPHNAEIGCIGPPTNLFIRVGEFPKANFTFFSNCSADNKVTFNSSNSLGGSALKDSIQNVYWNFHDPDTLVLVEDSLVSHEFPQGGVYEASLVVETALGCADTLSQLVSVFEIIDTADINRKYLETFNLGGGGWISTRENNNANGLATNSSWQITQINNSPAWVTANDTTGVFNDNEDSWVESPCFNLDFWDKPKIEMDIRYFTDKFEGTTLQYTISDDAVASKEVQWQTLGEIDGGINWFNSAGIAASPGGQTIGWEGGTEEWKKARISLDAVKEKAGGKPVRFRVAFASLELGEGRENNYDGFAFDNFAIRERNRMIVLEHFTNVGAVGNEEENSYVDDFVNERPLESVKIEYHTSYPASDPVYLLNKADQSAHTLEYGINDVPRTVMDGIFGVKYRNDPFSLQEWGKSEYAKRTILDAPFNLSISDTVITSGENQGKADEGLKIDVTITRNLTADTIFAPLVLEVGILQKSFEADGHVYHNVLRKLLPNASGTYIYGDWLPGDLSRTETVTQYWSPNFTYNPADSFLIVAYIHDTHLTKSKSKEIFQGAYKQIKKIPPNVAITGLGNNVDNSFKLYPNPSEGNVTLAFDQPLKEVSQLKVYSTSGLLVYEGSMKKGVKSFKIPLENYPDGLYIVSFYAQGQVFKRQLVLH